MNDGTEAKWACEFCTYENFPAAKKCTMCFKWRTPHLISDTFNDEQDIYKMAPLVSVSPTDLNIFCSSSSGSGESNKWACEICTYLNWVKSTKCVQCLNPKRKNSPPISQSQEKISSLLVNTSEGHQAINADNTTPTHLSPNTLSNNAVIEKTSNYDNKSSIYTSFQNPSKWICLTCTYENWPRSLKCVICGTPKEKISAEIQEAVGSSRSESNFPMQRRSPSASIAGRRTIVDRSDNYLAGASASSVTISPSSKQPSSPPLTREKRLAVLRSKLRDSDWLWLNACMGAVDGDLEAIHAFIAGGGHPSRQLTMQEVELLDRPSAFQVYSKLILFYRFERFSCSQCIC